MSAISWLGLIVILLHIAGIIAAIDAVFRARTAQGSIAWAVLLISFPYFALIPYFIFGSSRFGNYVQAQRKERERLREQADALPWQPDLSHQATGNLPATARLTHMPTMEGHTVKLLINGDATFKAIFSAIEKAQHHVIVEFFTVLDDDLGEQLFERLLERAAAGVTVYFLCDGIGSHALPHSAIARLRKGGVKAYKFVTQRGIGVNRFQVNFRNHRKLVIVDGESAFVGGHNVSDLYVGKKPPLSPWRDTHIEIHGPVIDCLHYSFAEDWFWSAGELPEIHTSSHAHKGGMLCQALPTGPADQVDICIQQLLEIIGKAQHRLWMSTPYLVPDEAVMEALKLAVNRGVDVRIIVPARADHEIVYLASRLSVRRCIEAGMRIFRFQPGFVHQKVWLMDDECAVIGSANLDNRSMRLNFELMVATFDPTFAAQVAEMLEDDFSKSKEVRQAHLDAVPKWHQIGEHIAHLFAPIL
ncbi:putative cardiolipin synthase YwiE [Halomonadaceae bacterium LMG 33818]|uniref:cardiolipin synthase n=1 Tax=Cernens ardua TaxID=3402176 RepID=UPI003EDB8E1B